MSNKQFQQLQKNVLVVENTTKDKARNKNDKLLKIHLVLEAVRKNSMAIKPVPVYSIDNKSFLQK